VKKALSPARTYAFLFALLLLLFYQAGQVWHALPLRPQSLHISAQCDRASIARNFYRQEMNIFKPRIDNLVNGSGIGASEFPLVNFLAACCYKLFGFNELWFRLISMLFFTAGFVFSWKLARLLLQNESAALICSFLWLASPTLLYYIPNFNPDPAALGMTMIAWYAFFNWQKDARPYTALLCGFSLTLAMLMKASAAISMVAMCGLIVLDMAGWLHRERTRLIRKKMLLIACLSLAALIAYSWYAYAQALNEKHYARFFTLFTRIPESKEQMLEIWNRMKDWLLLHWYAPWMLGLIPIMQLLTLIFHSRIPRQLIMLCWMLGIGSLSFIFLMFVAIGNHDYYIIPLLPWIFFLLLSMGLALLNSLSLKWLRLAGLAASILLTVNVAYCHKKNSSLYDESNLMYYEPEFMAYYDLEPKLRERGIQRTDLFLSMTDVTYDVSLYLIGQKGYTYSEKKDLSAIFYYLLERGASYLLINSDSCLPSLPVVKKFFGEPVLTHGNLKLYKASQDPDLRQRILDRLRDRLKFQRRHFLHDMKWVDYNSVYSKVSGVPYGAVLDESSLYLFQLKEADLKRRLSVFVKEKYKTEAATPSMIEDFVMHGSLDASEEFVLTHPYAHWFDDL
jgi:hypothetical protein